jgi:dUTP pyrophosphatase
MYILLIKTNDEELKKLYESHSTFHNGDAGLDLFVPKEITVNYGERVKVNHNIQTALISCTEINTNILTDIKYCPWRLLPRSSIVKTPLIMSNSEGIIDAGYRGFITGVVDHIKHNEESYVIPKHSRLFQVITPTMEPIMRIKFLDDFDETSRGTNGFGSTN